ncbi:MAG: FAD-binding oxidoreductase [Armatimonadetes bacterium]|nr:FAD-binding oxidoreductase [Armatimonadota bacterium]
MPTRRVFLQSAGLLALSTGLSCLSCRSRRSTDTGSLVVNDIHSQLNRTRVAAIETPDSLEALRRIIMADHKEGKKPICIAGGRHAMGGQQFASDALLVDTRSMNRVLHFDEGVGIIEVEAGIQWPDLVDFLLKAQKSRSQPWGIKQKQTGADRLCLGGALAANIHGRGLQMKPFIEDVESFVLVDADGRALNCSRSQNAELFRLAIGGYGLFGIVHSLKLRLMHRQKIERVVELTSIEKLAPALEERIREGFLYGDFQYATDEKSDLFLREGVFSCYRPVDLDTPLSPAQDRVSERAWEELVYLAHVDKSRAYRLYADYYLSTSGQIYWSDTHQLGAYLENYHRRVDRRTSTDHPATEVITEIYVPRPRLVDFMEEAREDFRKNHVNVIYGTIRWIERDEESFLAWAKQPYACIIFNLHTVHTPEGIEHSAEAFRRLNDMAIRREGNFYLTYHRYAGRRQVEAGYPQFADFLRFKEQYDPRERFQSEWYRYYKQLFV